MENRNTLGLTGSEVRGLQEGLSLATVRTRCQLEEMSAAITSQTSGIAKSMRGLQALVSEPFLDLPEITLTGLEGLSGLSEGFRLSVHNETFQQMKELSKAHRDALTTLQGAVTAYVSDSERTAETISEQLREVLTIQPDQFRGILDQLNEIAAASGSAAGVEPWSPEHIEQVGEDLTRLAAEDVDESDIEMAPKHAVLLFLFGWAVAVLSTTGVPLTPQNLVGVFITLLLAGNTSANGLQQTSSILQELRDVRSLIEGDSDE